MTAHANLFSNDKKEEEMPIPFGREESVRFVFSKLVGNPEHGPQSCALIGPPFIGKSKVLDCIVNPSVQIFYGLDQKIIYPIRLDCAEIPLTRTDAFKQLGELAGNVIVKVWNLQNDSMIGIMSALRQTQNVEEAKNRFEDLLIEVNSSGHSLVYVLDNFEKLLSLFVESDIQFLRDIFSNYRHALVVAIPKPLIDLTPKTYPSQFYLIFRHHSLGLYSEKQAEKYLLDKFCSSDIKLDDDEVNIMLRQAGYHPHILQIYSTLLLNKKRDNQVFVLSEQTTHVIEREALNILNKDFTKLWQALDYDRQSVLLALAKGFLVEEENIKALQSLESEFGLVFRRSGHFLLVGELLKVFITSQTSLINQLAKTDYYLAGINALEQLKDSQYWGTDPIVFYKQAFCEFSREKPDYYSSMEMICQAYEYFLDVIVKRLELKTKHVYSGDDLLDKVDYLAQVLGLEKEIVDFLKGYWFILKKVSPNRIDNETYFQSIFRFYVLSGVIQLLVNTPSRYSVLQNLTALDTEYQILEKKEMTDHSVIYKARHRLIETRCVAIKSVALDKSNANVTIEYQNRLIREGVIVAKLNHPNIGKLYHVMLDPVSLILEWVEGESLEEYVGEGKKHLSQKEIINIGIKLADALTYAHTLNVTHRDIKPQNIILRSKDDPVLIDFDISRAPNLATISKDEDGKYGYRGTLEYSSPEQFTAPQSVGAPSDIFSLAFVLYKLITNKNPFELGNLPSMYENERFPKLLQHNIHPHLFSILCSCLSQIPYERLDAKTLSRELKSFQKMVNED